MPTGSSVTVAQLSEFDEIIDVRSPSEYADDHIADAVSAPVLNDEERARIGTLHKQASAFDAKRAGAALVARNIARHLEERFSDRPKSWRPLVYCWRGGQRSGSMTEIFNRIGWRAAQLEGGYKAYRRTVIEALTALPEQFNFRIVCGLTGSGKSRLLGALGQEGAQVLDLEAIAKHRGSVLGHLPGEPQPSQRMFESLVWASLTKLDRAQPVFVEAESKKVGALHVPDALMARMRQSPCVRLELAQDLRVALLKQEYAHFLSEPSGLLRQLDCLVDLHGHEVVNDWKRLATEGQWDLLVARLLTEHYDPAYSRGMARNYEGFGRAAPINAVGIDEAAMRVAARASQAALE